MKKINLNSKNKRKLTDELTIIINNYCYGKLIKDDIDNMQNEILDKCLNIKLNIDKDIDEKTKTEK